MELNEDYIKSTSTCQGCGGKEMTIGYTFGEGALHKKTSVFGMDAYKSVCDVMVVVCKSCGLLVKSYAKNPEKLP